MRGWLSLYNFFLSLSVPSLLLLALELLYYFYHFYFWALSGQCRDPLLLASIDHRSISLYRFNHKKNLYYLNSKVFATCSVVSSYNHMIKALSFLEKDRNVGVEWNNRHGHNSSLVRSGPFIGQIILAWHEPELDSWPV